MRQRSNELLREGDQQHEQSGDQPEIKRSQNPSRPEDAGLEGVFQPDHGMHPANRSGFHHAAKIPSNSHRLKSSLRTNLAVRFWALLHFYYDVTQSRHSVEPVLVVRGRLWVVGYQRRDYR